MVDKSIGVLFSYPFFPIDNSARVTKPSPESMQPNNSLQNVGIAIDDSAPARKGVRIKRAPGGSLDDLK